VPHPVLPGFCGRCCPVRRTHLLWHDRGRPPRARRGRRAEGLGARERPAFRCVLSRGCKRSAHGLWIAW